MHLLGDCAKTCICFDINFNGIFKSPESESSQPSEKKKLKASVEILENFVDQRDREDNRGDGKRKRLGREAMFAKERSRAGGRKRKR